MSDGSGPILYVLVIGFHHKKGCQVEYSFPPLVPGSPNECPAGWKYLPTLALPDGSHNYDYDTVYFHLPSLTKPRQTIYGISCFRQIPIEKLKNVTSDITRGTVQKSVCVLSKVPYYGHIQVKMELITHAYFDEGDFSKVSLLEDTYHHLNSVLKQSDSPSQTFVGLSARDFILQWKHKAVLLFKLLLLEKRVVFYKSPVHPLCSTILTLLSLHPGMIEHGLDESASIRLSRPMSPMPNYSDDDITPETSPRHTSLGANKQNGSLEKPIEAKTVQTTTSQQQINVEITVTDNAAQQSTKVEESSNDKSVFYVENTEVGTELTESTDEFEKKENSSTLQRNNSTDAMEESLLTKTMASLALIKTEKCGFPMSIFKQGYLCLPYLSLSYMDLLTDCNTRGYLVGATNVLFTQKRHLYDVLVDVETGRIECRDDPELRRQLHLSTEDLRFGDYVTRHVELGGRSDVFLDGVGFEGGEEWIRGQFKGYLLCLVRTSLCQDGSREIENFNSSYISAWKDTYNYKMWNNVEATGIMEVNPGHPFAGQLSVSDMKLRLSHTMNNTEGGRKINQAMVSTGRAVATTSKAVGGAISHAKGAFSSWFSNLMVNPEPSQNEEINKEESDNNDEKIITCSNKKEKELANCLIVEESKSTEKSTIEHKSGEVHTI